MKPRSHVPWTPEQDAWLIDNYGRVGAAECANVLGHTKKGVYHRAGKFGLKLPAGLKASLLTKHINTYTPDEDRWLVENYADAGQKASADYLGRGVGGVRDRASRLGLRISEKRKREIAVQSGIRCSKIFKGKTRILSEEHLASIRRARALKRGIPTGRRHTEEFKKRLAERNRQRTPEQLAAINAKIGDAHRGKRLSAGHRRNIGDARRGKKASVQTRRRQSIARLRNDREIQLSIMRRQLAEIENWPFNLGDYPVAIAIQEENSLAGIVPDFEKIQLCTDPQWLVAELRKATELSVQHVARMATLIRKLEELGHEVQIELGPLPFLRKIAYGNMIPELYVALECDPALLSRAGSLPKPDQEKIAGNKPMKVMELSGDHRMIAPLSMTRPEVNQVFGRGKIRSESEQMGWLRERVRRQQAKAPPMESGPAVTIDRKRRGIVANGAFIPAADLAHYLGELSRLK